MLDNSGIYPKLFRSSTIENDYSGQYKKIWKCLTCDTLHVFSNDGRVEKVFINVTKINEAEYTDEGIMFDDYHWDEITERNVSNEHLSSVKPLFYVKFNTENLVISETSDYSKFKCYKVYQPEWMK